MTKIQKWILAVTCIIVGILLHISFLEWTAEEAGYRTPLIKLYSYSIKWINTGIRINDFQDDKGLDDIQRDINLNKFLNSRKAKAYDVKYNFGIYEKYRGILTMSVLLGLILPIVLFATATFIYYSKGTD